MVKRRSLRPKLKGLVDAGKLCRYDAGIYYLPGKSKLKVIDAYISLYPTKVYKNLYETGVVYAIA